MREIYNADVRRIHNAELVKGHNAEMVDSQGGDARREEMIDEPKRTPGEDECQAEVNADGRTCWV